jgi:hypothetical protein
MNVLPDEVAVAFGCAEVVVLGFALGTSAALAEVVAVAAVALALGCVFTEPLGSCTAVGLLALALGPEAVGWVVEVASPGSAVALSGTLPLSLGGLALGRVAVGSAPPRQVSHASANAAAITQSTTGQVRRCR